MSPITDQHAETLKQINKLWLEVVSHTEIQTACLYPIGRTDDARAENSQRIIKANMARIQTLTGELIGELEDSAAVLTQRDTPIFLTRQAD